MNVLIVASKFPPEYSGPGVRMPRLYKEIGDRIGLKTLSVLCSGIEYVQSEEYIHEGIPVRRCVASYIRKRKFPFNFLNKQLLELAATVAENIKGVIALATRPRPDYIHILGTSGLTAAALFWARLNSIPVLQELVTAKATPCQRFLLLGKACPPRKSVIITMQNEAKKRCEQAGYAEQIWHRPNPFNEMNFHPVTQEEKSALRRSISQFADNDIVLCSVAKIIPQKNQIFLIDVLKELDDKFKLIIAGPAVSDGPLYERDKAYMDAMRLKIKEHGLENRVHIHTGYVESHIYMKASDIYMLPAYDEGFGTPMMESVACSVPVVANGNEPAFAEWLINGQNGYLPPPDPKAWARACGEASSASMEKKREEARKIVNLAGQTHIYSQYIDKINGLTRS